MLQDIWAAGSFQCSIPWSTAINIKSTVAWLYCTHYVVCLLYTWLVYDIILSSYSFYYIVKNMWYAKQKQLVTKKRALPSKLSRINASYNWIWLVRKRTDIKLQPSRLEYCYYQYIKATGKNKDWYQVVWPSGYSFPMV